MQSNFTSKLESLGFKLPEWCIPPSNTLISEFEKRFSLTLPADYRDFLVYYGGGVIGSANCPFQEPTPCGRATYIYSFCGFTSSDRHDNAMAANKLIAGAPDVTTLRDNLMGARLASEANRLRVPYFPTF